MSLDNYGNDEDNRNAKKRPNWQLWLFAAIIPSIIAASALTGYYWPSIAGPSDGPADSTPLAEQENPATEQPTGSGPLNAELMAQAREKWIAFDMRHFNMTRADAERFEEEWLDLGESFYFIDTSGRACRVTQEQTGPYQSEQVRKCEPLQPVKESLLDSVVALEFNVEYYAEGMNRVAQLKAEGYHNTSMVEASSQTWDDKPTTKYIVVMERPAPAS